MGLFRLVPVIFVLVAIGLGIDQDWVPFGIAIAFAVFGFWIVAMYSRGPERMGR